MYVGMGMCVCGDGHVCMWGWACVYVGMGMCVCGDGHVCMWGWACVYVGMGMCVGTIDVYLFYLSQGMLCVE